MKKVTIFFDTEGQWEQPGRSVYDEGKILIKIMTILKKHEVIAVFNTCGKVIEQYPKEIKMLDNLGHEIASHGYSHENFNQLSEKDAKVILEKTEKLYTDLIGKKIVGFRPPWVLKNKKIYSILNERGYTWISSDYIPSSEIFIRPDKKKNLINFLAKTFFKINKFNFNPNPHYVGNIIEIPLNSSMDGDILSLVSPFQESPNEWIVFAINSLKKQFDLSGDFFNLNFHPWLIGSENRLIILDEILKYIIQKGNVEFVLAKNLKGYLKNV